MVGDTMWILQWLPWWLFYVVLALGLIGLVVTYLLKFIPLPIIHVYKTPLQIASIILVVIGVYMLGSIANERAWQARIKELEVKVAQAEAEAAKENIKIVEKVVVQQKIVRERGQNIVQYVDREVVKYDTKCEIPKPFVDAHNRAAEKIQ
jgi:uncharacterized coiled-coil protein SlyX